MDQIELCQQCIADAGISWNSSMDSDVGEGLCPKAAPKEMYICEKTGKRVRSSGKIIIPCAA